MHDPVGVKLLTRLRLQLSHPNEHKFRHDFSPVWPRGQANHSPSQRLKG